MNRPTPTEALGQQLARNLDYAFNGDTPSADQKWGFALFYFEFGKVESGRVNYVSNASRPDMLVAVREWLARAEGRASETEGRA